MPEYKTLEDFDFLGQKVLVRVDFNVPIDKQGNITNDKRIRAVLPTIKYLLDNGVEQIILMSHMGRPKGQVIEELRLTKVGEKLSELLGMPVDIFDECIGIDKEVNQSEERIILLENLRFHKEEKNNDAEFAKKLSNLADIYVNDAFGVSHRAHASVEAITKFLPSCAGLLVEKELEIMGKALAEPKKPFVSILGGAKISTKIGVIENLIPKVDRILLGGAMIFTFYKAMGLEIGNSLVEEDQIETAKNILEKGRDKIILPIDIVCAKEITDEADTITVEYDKILPGWIGLDIGPKTIDEFENTLKEAKTIVWNGPLGAFETKQFAVGTNEVAKLISELDAVSIIGGGDSAAAIEKLGIEEKFTHISTGGGASLEFLEGKELPAIKALQDNAEVN
ncbi:phosphoglycerate kinase [Nanoarchaeota archaeon]